MLLNNITSNLQYLEQVLPNYKSKPVQCKNYTKVFTTQLGS